MGAMRQDESFGVWGHLCKSALEKVGFQNFKCVNSVTERFGQKAAISRPERQLFFVTRPSAHIGLNDRNGSVPPVQVIGRRSVPRRQPGCRAVDFVCDAARTGPSSAAS